MYYVICSVFSIGRCNPLISHGCGQHGTSIQFWWTQLSLDSLVVFRLHLFCCSQLVALVLPQLASVHRLWYQILLGCFARVSGCRGNGYYCRDRQLGKSEWSGLRSRVAWCDFGLFSSMAPLLLPFPSSVGGTWSGHSGPARRGFLHLVLLQQLVELVFWSVFGVRCRSP